MNPKYRKKVIFNQFFGVGDILFIEPIIRKFFQEGHEVILPVLPKFLDLQPYFPYIKFVDMNQLNIDYDSKVIVNTEEHTIIPLRWGKEFFNGTYNDTMRNKYRMVNMELSEFRNLKWLRHRVKENELLRLLGIQEGEKYNLINKNFHTFLNGTVKIDVKNNYKNVYMNIIKDFTLLDWASVIENATEIHSVNTSILFLLESLDLKAENIHLYGRNDGGSEFPKTTYLHSKNYILHI